MAQRPIRATTAGATAATSRVGSGAATRERILDIALDHFVRKGYAETSLREIAAELGVSKAALYYHFASKEDILLALHLRVHNLTAGVLPLLQATEGDTWEQLVDELIAFALQNRRLLEMHVRNPEAIADLHRDAALEKHGQVQQHDAERYFMGLLRDPAAPLTQRVRRVASVGAIAGVLLASSAFADVPDAELESTLRTVVHDMLGVAPVTSHFNAR